MLALFKPLTFRVAPRHVSLRPAALRLLPRHPAPRRLSTTFIATPPAAERPPPVVGYWLGGVAAMVAGMVVLGGVTRLTRSGLSIVEWRAGGEALPRDAAGWEVEFAKYRATPEYARVNSRMTLDEFKPIYIMEWAHRAWGRAIGLAFALPLGAFVIARRVPASWRGRLGALLLVGGAQGGVGWWMVRSGLEAPRDPLAPVRVSPYRLATHLGFAWALYSALTWSALDILTPAFATVTMSSAAANAARALRPAALLATCVLGLTTASGPFVAGNDAGHAFNDWPRFAGRWVPEGIWDESLGVRNFFENTATVQFDHRNLAYATVAAVGGLHVAAARVPGGRAALPPAIMRGAIAMGALVAMQASLGIATLVMYVPLEIAAAHQAGALALWTATLYTLHGIQRAVGVSAGGRVAAAAPLTAALLLMRDNTDA